MMSKSNRHKQAKLSRLRNKFRLMVHDVRHRVGAYFIDNREIAGEIAPIFVVGANRSGTSLCTQILSMHPEIEGIFDGPQSFSMQVDGHSSGFGEAHHIWQSLNSPKQDVNKGECALWGLPSFVSNIYVASVSDLRKRQLVNELVSARKTDKIPLIKWSHNVLRIPLIKDLFPKARFVFVTRDHRSHIQSNMHKLTADIEKGLLSSNSHFDYPHIGLHWLLINTIALYDLKKYAKDDYIHIKLQDVHGEKSVRTKTMNQVFTFLNLAPVEVDDSIYDNPFIYMRSRDETDIDMISNMIGGLIDYETSLM